MMTGRAWFPGSDLAGVVTAMITRQGPCPRSYPPVICRPPAPVSLPGGLCRPPVPHPVNDTLMAHGRRPANRRPRVYQEAVAE